MVNIKSHDNDHHSELDLDPLPATACIQPFASQPARRTHTILQWRAPSKYMSETHALLMAHASSRPTLPATTWMVAQQANSDQGRGWPTM